MVDGVFMYKLPVHTITAAVLLYTGAGDLCTHVQSVHIIIWTDSTWVWLYVVVFFKSPHQLLILVFRHLCTGCCCTYFFSPHRIKMYWIPKFRYPMANLSEINCVSLDSFRVPKHLFYSGVARCRLESRKFMLLTSLHVFPHRLCLCPFWKWKLWIRDEFTGR